jgi:hypothetical protein
MDSHYETIKTPATPEYILEIFKDRHRLTCDFGESFEPDMTLTMDSTINDWRNAEDLLEWKPLGKALNNNFGIDLGDEEWKSLLEPESQKTLRGVCERIAKDTFQEQIKPTNLLGKSCIKGGIFLTIRSKLAQAGAPVDHLSPSSELAPYAKNHLGVFLEISSKLFPGKFPPVAVNRPIYDRSLSGFGIGFLIMFLGWIASYFTRNFGLVIVLIGMIGVMIFGRLTSWAASKPPKSVEVGDLKTFRDLVNYISEPKVSGS